MPLKHPPPPSHQLPSQECSPCSHHLVQWSRPNRCMVSWRVVTANSRGDPQEAVHSTHVTHITHSTHVTHVTHSTHSTHGTHGTQHAQHTHHTHHTWHTRYTARTAHSTSTSTQHTARTAHTQHTHTAHTLHTRTPLTRTPLTHSHRTSHSTQHPQHRPPPPFTRDPRTGTGDRDPVPTSPAQDRDVRLVWLHHQALHQRHQAVRLRGQVPVRSKGSEMGTQPEELRVSTWCVPD